MRRIAWLMVGVLGALLVGTGGYLIWLGWHARAIGIFGVWMGLMALLLCFLYPPRRGKVRSGD